jgi:hypothetical protein
MSRATLLNERPEEEDTDQLDTENTLETPEETQEPTLEETSVPEKYQGKSVEDLVQMHQELEKFSGKQSTEVGELRNVVDSYIQTELNQQNQAPQFEAQVQEDDTDFFIDPQTAVNRAIDNHPKIREAEAYAQRNRQQATLAQLKSNHPDMEVVLQDPKFAEWIKASKVRTKLFVQADQQYDYDAADELFNNWKERRDVVNQTAQAEKVARKGAVKSASAGNARGSSEGSRKKIYRRADIIKLMKNDPDRYMALQPEIMAAYADKRVK